MDDLSAEVGNQLAQALAAVDDFLAGLDADLPKDADDIALLGRSFRADNEVGAAQDEEVQRVVFERESVIDQLADLAGRRGGLDLVEVGEGLGGGHVMRGGADTADAAGDLRHVLRRAAEGEHLETAQLGHLEVGALDVALVIEKDVDLAVAFEAGDRVDGEPAPAVLVGGVGAEVALVESLLGGGIHITCHWPGDSLCGATCSWRGRNGRRCRWGPGCPPAPCRCRLLPLARYWRRWRT